MFRPLLSFPDELNFMLSWESIPREWIGYIIKYYKTRHSVELIASAIDGRGHLNTSIRYLELILSIPEIDRIIRIG
jgi:hypothetical protein